MNERASSKPREVGRSPSPGGRLSSSRPLGVSVSPFLERQPLLSGLFDHMLGEALQVAASCHTCVPTKVNGTRAHKWHRGSRRGRRGEDEPSPRLQQPSGPERRTKLTRKTSGARRGGGWRWKPRVALVSRHRRLRRAGCRGAHGRVGGEGESRRVAFGSVGGKEKVQRPCTMVINGSLLNSSSPDPSDTVLYRPPWVTTTLGCFLIFTIVVDILGNLLVIFSVYRNKKLRNAGEVKSEVRVFRVCVWDGDD